LDIAPTSHEQVNISNTNDKLQAYWEKLPFNRPNKNGMRP
jgi:hypothetical protein